VCNFIAKCFQNGQDVPLTLPPKPQSFFVCVILRFEINVRNASLKNTKASALKPQQKPSTMKPQHFVSPGTAPSPAAPIRINPPLLVMDSHRMTGSPGNVAAFTQGTKKTQVCDLFAAKQQSMRHFMLSSR